MSFKNNLIIILAFLCLVFPVSKIHGATWCYSFNKNIGISSSGTDDVIKLHLALQDQNISFSPDSYNAFSTATTRAVLIFQNRYGILQTGLVGVITRAKLNSLYGCKTPILNSCMPTWKCSAWTTCQNGQQMRSCIDTSKCLNQINQPVLTQSCFSPLSIACKKDSDCGSFGFVNSAYCVSGNSYQIYRTYSCLNPGTPSAVCENFDFERLKTVCPPNQICKSGSCQKCSPSWKCTSFGACSGGMQSRICYDQNNCHDATNAPVSSQYCR